MCDESISDYESRAIGGTENSWCRGVSGGTGITVLSLVLHKQPNVKLVENALQHLHIYHPILGAKLHLDPATATFSLLIPSCSSMKVEAVDYESTAKIIQSQEQVHRHSVTPFEILVEYELNNNPWENLVDVDVDVMHVSVYEMIDGKWVVMMKLHTGICDRTAAVAVMKELMGLMMDKDQGKEEKGEVMMSVEEYIPSGKMNKPFWSRGVDMLGYSLNSFRLNNLDFSDPNSPRSSRLVRFFMDSNHTSKLLQGCKDRGIKLCGPLSAAALIAARSSKCVPDGEWEKYAVVTLIDCRKLLQPTLSTNHVGFYHSAILNTHDMKGGEELWELAGRTYASFEDAKNSNKHFTDMADLNFLMCRAIENPGLTPSSSLRTSFISVFEDPVIDETNENYEELGVEDYMGCASTHGVGPSIAVFDTVRQGKLDCTCVYPFPLHSREQMQELIDNMKKILIDYL